MQIEVLYVLLSLAMILMPIMMVVVGQQTSYYFFIGVVMLTALSLPQKVETYERMVENTDYFPWNEANMVRKRIPNSTTIDCEWVQDRDDDGYVSPTIRFGDPVVHPGAASMR